MRKVILSVATAASLALSASLPGAAQAAEMMVAGWDFSQWQILGVNSIDGATLTNTLSANFSDLDPNGVGLESAAFGTMHMDGQFGSSQDPLDFTWNVNNADFAQLVANDFQQFDLGNHNRQFNSADANVSVSEGAQLGVVAAGMEHFGEARDVVFAVNLTSVPEIGQDWWISFAAMLGGTLQPSSIGIEFSTDGVNYAPVTTVALTAVDTRYQVALGATPSDTAYVKFVLGSDGSQLFDGVAIVADVTMPVVPEPATGALLLSGLAAWGLAFLRRA